MASDLDPYKVLPGNVTNDEIREALDNVSDVLTGTGQPKPEFAANLAASTAAAV